MPSYPWLIDQKLDNTILKDKMKALRKLGIPYTDAAIANAEQDLNKQAQKIADDLKQNQVNVLADREIIAVIAYLQRLGTDIKAAPKAAEDVNVNQ
ncbi:Cytochrome C oxidase, mono-heme subunit/FixO [compost metagenome]